MSHSVEVLTSKKSAKGVTYMKKEVIIVPKDKCPLNLLAEMGESIRNSWIFLHENAYERLVNSEGAKASGVDTLNRNKTICLIWEATEEYPKTVVFCEVPPAKGWGKISGIEAEDISYSMICPNDPEDIFFLKMEE